MNPSLIAYDLATALACAALPGLWLAARQADRLKGRLPRVLADLGRQATLYRHQDPGNGGPRVWLQAVSVGEATVAAAVARHLRARLPQVHLTVSSSTGRGLEAARLMLEPPVRVIPYPLDLKLPVARAVGLVRPHVYAVLETELWPNLLGRLAQRGTALLMLNGRISPRSFPRYRLVKPLVARCLGLFNRLSMISPDDAQRVLDLGAPPERVSVDQNAKYDGLLPRALPQRLAEPAARLALGDSPLLVAGSVRSPELEALSRALGQVISQNPRAVAAVAPRHVEKADQWFQAFRSQGLAVQYYSQLSAGQPRQEQTRVVVVDTTGDLFKIYGLARAAFLGASLAPLGGQNPMEPAAWAVPCLFGPSMEDFADAAGPLLAKGGGRQVRDADELARAFLELLTNPEAAQEQGQAARAVLAARPDAAAMAAELIEEQLVRMGALA